MVLTHEYKMDIQLRSLFFVLLVFAKAQGQGFNTQCFICTNNENGVENTNCPKTGLVSFDSTPYEECSGACFTMGDANDESRVMRGCTASLQNLPELPPVQDCFDYQGTTFCICSMALCNMGPLGVSSGESLDPPATTKPDSTPIIETTKMTTEKTATTTTTASTAVVETTALPSDPTKAPSEPAFFTQCFMCANFVGPDEDPTCPGDGVVAFDSENGTCNGYCFTMRDNTNPELVMRGCTSMFLHLPQPLPPLSGCYDWQGATYCVCAMALCNAVPMGESTGISMDAHLVPQTTPPTMTTNVPTTKAPATTKKPSEPVFYTQCFMCTNFIGASEDPSCPGEGLVSFEATQDTCSGACFTMRDSSDEKLVIRGCTAMLPFLPESLPPVDGCYDWQGSTFCVCRMGLCNMAPIGQSSGVSLDAHLNPPATTTTTTKKPSVPQFYTSCFTCASTDPKCPAEAPVSLDAQNETCPGVCYTRKDPQNQAVLKRGCTDAITDLPDPLPPVDGCYDWQGSTICICRMGFCNMMPLGQSTGIALDAHLGATTVKMPTPKPTEPDVPTICYECISHSDGNYNADCPKNDSVNMRTAYYGECNGICFIRSDKDNDKLVVRGCTEHQGNLPSSFPADGCYDWNGATYCICRSPRCNKVALGKSSGVSLDAHIKESDEIDNFDPDLPLQCYECISHDDKGTYYPQCPIDGRVNPQTVYHGNCTGSCFSRTYKGEPGKMGRGCTDSQYGMPLPLPKDGCYDKDGETWCLCTKSGCNGHALGTSSGVAFDAHLDEIEPPEEEDGINKCYECVNYDSYGNYYPQCAKNSRVKNAYLGPCNGTCFTRSFDYDDRLVARGCSTTQYGLPDPLPPDGCYKWYSEVWCVCSKSRCNGVALGVPTTNVEFDAHIVRDGGSSLTTSGLYHVFLTAILCLFSSWLIL